MARRDVEIFRENPFIEKLADMRTRKKRVTVKSGKAVMDVDTGEIEDVAEIVAVQQIDSAQFVKVYSSGLRDWFNLKPAALRLAQCLIHEVAKTPNADKIFLNAEHVGVVLDELKVKGMSRPTYNKGMTELLKKGFVAETPAQNLYWINPSLLWNGDRIRFVKEYRINRTTQADLPDLRDHEEPETSPTPLEKAIAETE